MEFSIKLYRLPIFFFQEETYKRISMALNVLYQQLSSKSILLNIKKS